MTTDFAAKSRAAGARSAIYDLLASVYNMLPSVGFMANMKEEDVHSLVCLFLADVPASTDGRNELKQGIRTIGGFWAKVRDVPPSDVLLRLSVDRTRLFRGLKPGYGPPPPYESVYRENESIMGRVTTEVRDIYIDLGYTLPAGCNEPPDYVGLELGFLRYLSGEEAAAWSIGNRERALTCLSNEISFLGKHMLEWVPKFCDNVVNDAREDFYRGIAQVTKAFIRMDARRLQSLR